MTFTGEQLGTIRSGFSIATVTLRFLTMDSIDKGNEIMAGFYARELVQVERAAHVAWNMSEEFPTE